MPFFVEIVMLLSELFPIESTLLMSLLKSGAGFDEPRATAGIQKKLTERFWVNIFSSHGGEPPNGILVGRGGIK